MSAIVGTIQNMSGTKPRSNSSMYACFRARSTATWRMSATFAKSDGWNETPPISSHRCAPPDTIPPTCTAARSASAPIRNHFENRASRR